MSFLPLEIDNLRDIVRQNMEQSRFAHTLRVENEAARMGAIYLPESVADLRAAAILHDLTKGIKGEEQITLCEELGLVLTDDEKRAPQVLHGLSAASIVERDLPQFATDEILQAIRVHTTGDVEMSVFSLVLFVADFIEAGRTYDACRDLRERYWEWVEQDKTLLPLLRAAYEELLFTVQYLEKNNEFVAPKTRDAIEAMRKRIECEDSSCL